MIPERTRKIIKTYTCRARAEFRKIARAHECFWVMPQSYQEGSMVAVVSCVMSQAKREHPHLKKEHFTLLRAELFSALELLVPPADMIAEYGRE